MKFAVGLVLSALAVTAAHAGQARGLRASGGDQLARTGQLEDDDADGSLNDEPAKKKDDLMVKVKVPAGSKDEVTVNIMDLIGSGSGKAEFSDVFAAYLKAGGVDVSDDAGDEDPIVGKGANPGSGDDFSWLSSGEPEDGDPLGAKGAKGALPLEDEEEDEEVDPIGAKGGAGDPLGAKGAKGALPLEDEEEDEEEDPIGAKGGDKSTKAPKSTKEGAEGGSLAGLFDEGTDGLIGDEGEPDAKTPLLVAGGKKGKGTAAEDEPVFSEADLEDSPMQSEPTGTKDSKATK